MVQYKSDKVRGNEKSDARGAISESPHDPAVAVLVVELVQEEHGEDPQVYGQLEESGPDHLLHGRVAVLVAVHALHVDVEVLVLQLEAVQHQRDREVPELHEFREAQVQEAAAQPQDEFYQLQLGVDDLLEEEVEGEGVGEAEGKLEQVVLQDVPVNIEGVVPIVVHDERVHQRILLDEQDGEGEEEEVGSKGVARDVDALEEGVDVAEVLAEGDGEVAEAEEGQVEQLVGVQSHGVVLVVAEHQLPLVVHLQEHQEQPYYSHLEPALPHYLPLVVEQYPNNGEKVLGQRLGHQNGLPMVIEHPIDHQIHDPNQIVLPHEDRQQRREPQAPLTLCQIVVEHYGYQAHAGRVSVVEEVEEVEGRRESQVERARDVVRADFDQVVDFEDVDYEDVGEEEGVEGAQVGQLGWQQGGD